MDNSIDLTEEALRQALRIVNQGDSAWAVDTEAASLAATLFALNYEIVPVDREPLPDVAHARRNDPATSEIAAATIFDMKERHRAVMSVVSAFSEPFTYDELIYRYNQQRNRYGDLPKMEPQSIRSRCAELRRAGWIENTGERSKADAGGSAILWKAVR